MQITDEEGNEYFPKNSAKNTELENGKNLEEVISSLSPIVLDGGNSSNPAVLPLYIEDGEEHAGKLYMPQSGLHSSYFKIGQGDTAKERPRFALCLENRASNGRASYSYLFFNRTEINICYVASVVIIPNKVVDFTIKFSDILQKNNTTSYNVTGDYNPAHKKYVDDLINEKLGDIETLLQNI